MSKRISDNLLEYDEDIKCLDGIPFTGISFENFENNEKKSEIEYINGLENGIGYEWHPNGQIKSCIEYKKGLKNGKANTYFINGLPHIRARYEWGIEIDYEEFSENGNLLKKREINPNDPESNYKILEKFRRIYGN